MLRRQLPERGEVFLDHLAHFVPDLDTAAAALERLGFVLTPRTPQMTAAPDGSLVPAGTANRCVMLEEGYVEFLTAVADTPLTRRLQAQLERYVGVHLICFSDADPEAARSRLVEAGFAVEDTVALRRRIEGSDGREGELRFSVVRVPPGTMAEGRIQYVVHHTPDLLWQRRWMDHANGARALREVTVVVEDPDEAAERFACFTARETTEIAGGHSLRLDRGAVTLITPAHWREHFPAIEIPALPWIAGYTLEVEDFDATRRFFDQRSIAFDGRKDRLVVALPTELGGALTLTCNATAAPVC